MASEFCSLMQMNRIKEYPIKMNHERSEQENNGAYPTVPRVAVGAVIFKDDKVLLVLRRKPPAENQWSIPGGCVELGETLQEAAEREILEETGIFVRAREPIFSFDVIERDEGGRIRFHYVILDLAADYIHGKIKAGDDALEASWVSSKEINARKVSAATRKLLKECYGFGE